MNFVTWSIRNPAPVIILFIGLTIAGLISFPKLGVQDRPDIEFPAVIVTITYPGVAPTQMESEITRKVEDSVATISGIEQMTSTVDEGASTTSIEFAFGTDLSRALDDVRDAVTRIRSDLPPDANEPIVSRTTTAGGSLVTWSVASDTMSDTELSWFVDLVVSRELSSVNGMGRVTRVGGVDREIRVDLDPDRMAALGATASDVSRQLRRIQAEYPGGEARLGGLEQTVRTTGIITSVYDLTGLPISLPDGRSVRLDTIADVRDQASEQRAIALLNGKPVVGFQIVRAWGASALGVAKDARKVVEQLAKDYPHVKFAEASSTVGYIQTSYDSSMEMLIEGAVLAIFVVWLFLRDWRATLVSALASASVDHPDVLGHLGARLHAEHPHAARAHARRGHPRRRRDRRGREHRAASAQRQEAARGRDGRRDRDRPRGGRDDAYDLRRVHSGRVHGRHRGRVLPAVRLHRNGRRAVLAARRANAHADDGRVLPEAARRAREDAADHDVVPRARALVSREPLEDARRRDGRDRRHARAVPAAADGLLAGRRQRLYAAHGRARSGLLARGHARGGRDRAQAARDAARFQGCYTAIGTQGRSSGFGGGGSAGTVRRANLTITIENKTGTRGAQQAFERRASELLRDIPGARIQFDGSDADRMGITLAGDDSGALARVAANVEREMRQLPGLGTITSSASLQQPEIVIRPLADRAADLGVTTETLSLVTRIATSGDVDTGLAKFNLDNRQIPIRVRLNDKSRTNLERLKLLDRARAPGSGAADECRRRLARLGPGGDHAHRPQPQHHAECDARGPRARRRAQGRRQPAVDEVAARGCPFAAHGQRALDHRDLHSVRSRDGRSASRASTPCS